MEERNAAGSLAAPFFAETTLVALIDPTMLLNPSAGASPQPDYATDASALLGDAAPAPAPPEDATAAPTPAAPTSLPLSSTGDPQTPDTANASASQDAIFAGLGDAAFADPLGGAPAPSSPSLASPPAQGGGSGGGASTSAYVAPILPTSGGGTPAAMPNMPMTPVIPPSYPSLPSMPGMSPSAPPTWVNGAPSFHWAAPTAPAVDAIGPQANAEGDPVHLQVHAVGTNFVDPSSNYRGLLSYDAVGLPAGLTIDHYSGLISGTIYYSAAEAFSGAYKPTVIVADSEGGQSVQTFAWTVADTVRPPAFTSALADQTNNIGDKVGLQANAAQPDGDQLIYDDNGTLPSGLTIDSLSGAISGTIADDAAPSYAVTLTATDNTPLDDTPPGNPLVASESFTWTVNTLHDPTLTAPPSQVNAANDPVSLTVQGGDAPGNTLTYGATNLPDGLAIDTGSGLISGTVQGDAARSAPYDVTATVSDGTYQTSEDFSWTVNAVGVASPGDQGNQVGDKVSLPITGNEAGLTYSVSVLPPGLTIDADSGAISGVILPTADTNNPYSVTVTATDGPHSGSTTFAWDVSPWAPADRADVEGAYALFAGAAPSTDPNLSYSATGLPGGVDIDPATGVLSGTLTQGDAAAGPYAVEVTTTTTGIMGSSSTSQDFTWTVTPVVDVPPTLTNPGDQTGVAGLDVTLGLSATDLNGTLPAFSASGLPDGLTIDEFSGVISGVPAEDAIQADPYAVTVTMDDGNGGSTTQTFNWTVNDSTLSIQGDAISQQAGAGVDTFQVATFTDPNLNRQASDYAATITWGDGQTSACTVDGGNGAYTVSGDHAYLHPNGDPVQVTVTDPTGATATSTATATVTPAPLTLTGNFQDGATSGLVTTFTVATFIDANGYLASGDFTATINWGDDTTTTTGVIDGADGAFRVTGNHTFASDGTYTVVVTVTDADGAAATTTSQVTAGDIQAGLDNTLTVAAFTSADPNATAASFTAMIQWGDGGIMMGGTAGTVVQEGNGFAVLGAHAFQAAGAYTVQVTVYDQSGDQLTGSDTVQAAPAPATGFGGDLAAENGYLMDGPLALFTLPQGYGPLGQYTATADWGDGTSSSASVFDNGSILEALRSHSYATMGVFAVQTLLRDAAGRLVAAADSNVHAVPPSGTIHWTGPSVVPGNSTYQYQINFPGAGIPADDINPPDQWTFTADDATGSAHHTEQTVNGTVYWTGFNIELSFQNKPEVVNVLIGNLFKGDSNRSIHFSVDVVQVKLVPIYVNPETKQGLTPPFSAGGVHDGGTATVLQLPINGVNVKETVQNVNTQDLTGPGLNWQAAVDLTAPTGHAGDVKDILIGFVQHIVNTVNEVRFPSLKKVLVGTLDHKKTFLDAFGKEAGPYYKASAVQTGTSDGMLLGSQDSPQTDFPIAFKGAIADRVDFIDKFTLDVTAATTDTSNGANKQLEREAASSWSVNMSGTIALAPGGDGYEWQQLPNEQGHAVTGVFPPDPNEWQTGLAPLVEPVAGPTFNAAVADSGFVSEDIR